STPPAAAPPPAALASAAAHGAAAVTLPGSAMPTPADLAPGRVTVTPDVPHDRRLTQPVAPPPAGARS
ncbi:hypothetical protein AB0M28_35065, partial [Streptomyces sp. NPDC051940]